MALLTLKHVCQSNCKIVGSNAALLGMDMRDNKNSLRNTLPQTQLPLLRKLKPWIGSNNFGLTKAMELTAKLG